MSELKHQLMTWSAPKLCNAHAQLEVTGYDNGDGDGPHWFVLNVDTQSAGDFGGSINITVNSLEELKKLSDSFARAYHKAISIKENNESLQRSS